MHFKSNYANRCSTYGRVYNHIFKKLLYFIISDLFLTTLSDSNKIQFEMWLNKVRRKVKPTYDLKTDRLKKHKVKRSPDDASLKNKRGDI